MAVQMLPGLWDQIKPEAMGLMSQIMQRVNPDFHANKRMQEMVQQNPQILDQLANMDDGQRAAFAQAMGFRKQDPTKGIAPGAERQKRERIAATRANASSEQLKLADDAEAGLPDPFVLGRRVIKAEQEDKNFDIDYNLKNLQKSEQEYIRDKRMEAVKRLKELEAKYPDSNPMSIVKKVYAQTANAAEMEQFEMFVRDPDYRDAFKILLETEQFNQNKRLSLSMRSEDRAGQQSAKLHDWYMNQLKSAQAGFLASQDDMQNAIKDPNGRPSPKLLSVDPARKAMYEKAKTNMDRFAQEYDRINGIVSEVMKQPKMAPLFSPEAASAPDVLAEQAREAIRQRPKDAGKIRDSYKNKTGKDLPP